MEKKKKFVCSCCGTGYTTQDRSFRSSKVVEYAKNNYRLTLCNRCVDNVFNEILEIYEGDYKKTIKDMCIKYGWYYDVTTAAKMKFMTSTKSVIGEYVKQMNLGQFKNKTYIDYLKEQQVTGFEEDLTEIDETDEYADIINESQKIFGALKNRDDAIALKRYYDDWVSRTGASSVAQLTFVKNICWNLLNIQKKRALNESTKDLEEELRKNITIGGWKPDTKDEQLSQLSFGVWIKKYEMNKPVEEYKDKSYLKELVEVYYKGHTAHAYGLKNMYSDKYEKHMEKHTVKKDTKANKERNEAKEKLFGKQ